MYSTPAAGNSQNANDLEDYLLGKKRVDKILIADENAKVHPTCLLIPSSDKFLFQVGASHKNFIAVQNANSVRDVAAKVREDPLLAIKQQEQAAYQALLSNPLRLKMMREELGIKPKKDKEKRKREKEERKRLKQERKRGRDRSSSIDRYSRTPSPSARRRNRSLSPDHVTGRNTQRYRSYSRTPSPEPSRQHHEDRYHSRQRSAEHHRTRSRSSRRDYDNDRYRSNQNDRARQYGSPLPRTTRSRSPPPKRSRYSPPTRSQNDPDRSSRLAAMQSNATSMSEDRQKRLQALLEKERAELEADQHAREKSKGMSTFLSQEQKRVFGGSGGLEDRIRRGKTGLVVDAD